jgi:GDPmannose 4,6-dehydratase
MKRVLICGVGGQDGSYLSEFLLGKGLEVFGTSRTADPPSMTNLKAIGIEKRVTVLSMAMDDPNSVFRVLAEVRPDEVYNLAGQSSVGRSFERPSETFESIATATQNLLEGIRRLDNRPKFFNASSGECFGSTKEPADENTRFDPRSPYAVAKCAAHWQVVTYRAAFKMFACNGLLFSHESRLRPKSFVTQKIVDAARSIAAGSYQKLELGNLDVIRDWGWAPEYVEAMWLMLQQPIADDFIIATGKSEPLREFVKMAFKHFNLDWEKHISINPALARPLDVPESRANPAKAAKVLGWRAKSNLADVVRKLAE